MKEMSSSRLKLQMVAKTNVGKVREINEDNFIATNGQNNDKWVIPKDLYDNSPLGTIMVVADGMGGLNAGEVASRITVESIKHYFETLQGVPNDDSAIHKILVDSIIYAHKQILVYSTKHPETEGMGTTVIIAYILDSKVHIAWSGDSRCYIFRNDILTQLSKDHSYVQSLVDSGKITQDQAFFHPQSNVITQSLGDSEREPNPDSISFELQSDDILLLCTDGLNSMIDNIEIQSIILKKGYNLNICIDELIDKAIEMGGADNITIILNKVHEGGLEKLGNTLPYQDETYEEENRIEYTTLGGNKKNNKKRYIGIVLLIIVGGLLFTWYNWNLIQKLAYNKQTQNQTSLPKMLPTKPNTSITTTKPSENKEGKEGSKKNEADKKKEATKLKESVKDIAKDDGITIIDETEDAKSTNRQAFKELELLNGSSVKKPNTDEKIKNNSQDILERKAKETIREETTTKDEKKSKKVPKKDNKIQYQEI